MPSSMKALAHPSPKDSSSTDQTLSTLCVLLSQIPNLKPQIPNTQTPKHPSTPQIPKTPKLQTRKPQTKNTCIEQAAGSVPQEIHTLDSQSAIHNPQSSTKTRIPKTVQDGTTFQYHPEMDLLIAEYLDKANEAFKAQIKEAAIAQAAYDADLHACIENTRKAT